MLLLNCHNFRKLDWVDNNLVRLKEMVKVSLTCICKSQFWILIHKIFGCTTMVEEY